MRISGCLTSPNGGNSVKVDASKLHESINVKDHIDYEGFAPDTKYTFTGTLMKVENGKATPVSGVKPASVTETIGDSGKGTATVDFGKITDLKPDTQYVVFEKAVPVDDNNQPTVNNEGTPKNPSKDDRKTVTHENPNDSAQTFVTSPEGETVPPTSGTTTPGSESPAPSTSKPATPGDESTTPDTDKPAKPESSKTPGKPVPGHPSEAPEKPSSPKETTPEKPSNSADEHESEVPGKSGKADTSSSETPAPSNNDENHGDSNGSDNGTSGSSNGGSDNGSASSGNGSGSGSSSSHGVGGALASTGANVIWLALLAMILIGAGAGVVLWNRRRSHEG